MISAYVPYTPIACTAATTGIQISIHLLCQWTKIPTPPTLSPSSRLPIEQSTASVGTLADPVPPEPRAITTLSRRNAANRMPGSRTATTPAIAAMRMAVI
jgi:hypothetical protein